LKLLAAEHKAKPPISFEEYFPAADNIQPKLKSHVGRVEVPGGYLPQRIF
jgi:hypothetical protein